MRQKFTRDFREDYYHGLKGVYFFRILEAIIKIGDLRKRNVKVLDFGCGTGRLKELLPGKVIGYDISPELTEIKDWKKAKFDVVVSNEVFYLFSREGLIRLLGEIYKVNPNAELIVGISRQGIINKILSVLAGEGDAHDDTKLSPSEEIKTLKQKMDVIKKKTVFFMCDVYLLKFRDRGKDE